MCKMSRQEKACASRAKPRPQGPLPPALSPPLKAQTLLKCFFGSAHAERSQNNKHDGKDQKQAEQNLGNAGGTGSNTTKTERTGDERNYGKNDGIFKHHGPLCG
jgi:hypothetical protein